MKFRILSPGDPAPWASFPTPSTTLARIDLAAGRYIVLCFLGSARSPEALESLGVVHKRRQSFDDVRASFFGVTCDPGDVGRLKDSVPGIRFGLDTSRQASILYGAVSPEEQQSSKALTLRHVWYVLDPAMRILHVEQASGDAKSAANRVLDFLEALPPPLRHAGFPVPAPMLLLPGTFEPSFCRQLLDCFDQGIGTPSGFMDEADGKTILRHDASFKSRSDVLIESPALRTEVLKRIQRRVVPEIRKAFQFEVTRMERYLIARYDASEAGRFGAHRDNTTRGTAHRRFAVSVLLNDGYDGGELVFPEYGTPPVRVPAGCAIVFSCSLLHEVRPVTRGQRFVFVPFLYDEAAATIRTANNEYLGEGIEPYDADRISDD